MSDTLQDATEPDIFSQVPGWEGAEKDEFRDPNEGPESVSFMRILLEWGAVIAGALLAALLLQATLLKAFYIPSASMVPTLQVNDRVMVNKVAYSFGDPQIGDIVVFHRPDNAPDSEFAEFIKRVIAVPGDLIESRNGAVFINGEPLDEGYLPFGTFTSNLPPRLIPEGMLFVMGDNRGNSTDSRIFGPIDQDLVIGKAVVRVWPPSRISRL